MNAPDYIGEPVEEVLDTERPLRVEVYSRVGLLGRRYYWRVRHTSNGEIMAQHRGYLKAQDRDHAVGVLFPDVRRVATR